MVLESITDPLTAEKKPWNVFFIGALFTSVAVALSLWIFEEQASLISIFLIVMSCIPLMFGIIKLEEKKDLHLNKETSLLREHSKAIASFMFLFFGITLTMTAWYLLLPLEVNQHLFSTQTKTISEINNKVSGQAFDTAKAATNIFFNNVRVLVFCVLFSFLFGAGAIFILTWNASVIAAAIGAFVKGLITQGAYLSAFPIAFFRYMTHGTFEIAAYFIAGLAGGIISVAIIRHDFHSKKFGRILVDSSDLLIIAVAVLAIAAVIEVYVTPALF